MYMLKVLFCTLLVLNLTGCFAPEVCDPSAYPDREFVAGQKVVHLLNNEPVRVVQKYYNFTNNCYNKTRGVYKVRFADGTEVDTDWTDLR